MPDDIPIYDDEDAFGDDDESAATRRGRTFARELIVVGGGRGGVGKSLLAQNLAVYYAQLGKAVVLVDLDPTGSNMHNQLGVLPGSVTSLGDEAGWFEEASSPTSVPGLRLLPYPHDALRPPPSLRGSRRARFLRALRTLSADQLIVDVGPGHGELALDIMQSADVPILVTEPEPPAIEATYRFIRASYLRRLRRAMMHDRLRGTFLERALAELGRLPAPIDLVRTCAKADVRLGELAWAECFRTKHYLVVNQTRIRQDAELGGWMSDLAKRHYGVQVDELGHIEHDDTVWLSVRRRKPLLLDSPTSKAARNLERIARRVVALTLSRDRSQEALPKVPTPVPHFYALLGVARGAGDEEVRRAYKRRREMYTQEALPTASLLDDKGLREEVRLLDEAYDTLLDPIRRRAYDLSTFPEESAREESPREGPKELSMEQLEMQARLLRDVGPDTEFTGELLRDIRTALGTDLGDISARTKISKAYLQAIEEENVAALPAMVYVRGFVAELAKFLKLDPAQVQRSYLRRIRASAQVKSE